MPALQSETHDEHSMCIWPLQNLGIPEMAPRARQTWIPLMGLRHLGNESDTEFVAPCVFYFRNGPNQPLLVFVSTLGGIVNKYILSLSRVQNEKRAVAPTRNGKKPQMTNEA